MPDYHLNVQSLNGMNRRRINKSSVHNIRIIPVRRRQRQTVASIMVVRRYYSPQVSSILLNKNNLYGPLKSSITNFLDIRREKYNEPCQLSLQCYHKIYPNCNVRIHGIMLNKKRCYTHPYLVPDLLIDNSNEPMHTSLACAYQLDAKFRQDVKLVVIVKFFNGRNICWKR